MLFIDNKTAKGLILTLIVIVLLFLIGISVYLIKSSSEDSVCGSTYNNAVNDIDYKINGAVIVNDDVVLESISLDNKEFSYYNNYEFCVNGVVSSSDALKFVAYQEDTIIGNGYFSNGSGYHCFSVTSSFVKNDNFVGFSCDNCDTVGNNFTPVISVGTDTVLLVNGDTVIGDQLDYSIKGYTGCDYTVFRLFKYMMLTIVLFGLIFLLMLGVEYLKKVAFSGW